MTPDFRIRQDMVEVGRRIWQRGYVAASDGNMSVRLSDGRILITPTGRSKGFLEPDDMVIVDAGGRKLSGRLEPTSELKMHLFVYEARPDVSAVVHAHPPKATGFAVAGVHLAQCVLPEVILTLGGVPLTEYATPSTPEVPASIEQYIRSYNAMLLRSHGALTFGKDVMEAYYRMETVEHFAEITLTARALGGASPLSNEEVQKLLRARENLGLRGPVGTCIIDEPPEAAPGPSSTRQPEVTPERTEIEEARPQATTATEGPASDDDIVEAVLARLRASVPGRPQDEGSKSE